MMRRIVLRLSVSALEEADEVHTILTDEAAQAVREVPGLRALPPPAVRFDQTDNGRLCFTVTCSLEGLMQADTAQRELRKRLRARLRAAGVDARHSAVTWGLAWREPAMLDTNSEDAAVG